VGLRFSLATTKESLRGPRLLIKGGKSRNSRSAEPYHGLEERSASFGQILGRGVEQCLPMEAVSKQLPIIYKLNDHPGCTLQHLWLDGKEQYLIVLGSTLAQSFDEGKIIALEVAAGVERGRRRFKRKESNPIRLAWRRLRKIGTAD
jgi:hypothetical protein